MTTDAGKSNPRLSFAALVWVAVWLGLLAGFAELAGLGVRRAIGERFLFVSRDTLWMVPLAYAVLFGAVGVAIALLSVPFRGLRSLSPITFVGGALLGTAVVLLFPAVHIAAAGMLALGAGTLITRLALRRPEGMVRLARRSVGWLLLLVALLGGGLHGWLWLGEKNALRDMPAERPPNVLLLVMDTVRAKSLSAYGYARPTTPQLEKIAQQGVLFEYPIASSPWTLPSHATMMTGRFYDELTADWSDPLDDARPTLAEVLTERGYATGGFVANLNYCGYEVGIDRGFGHYRDYPISLGQVVLATSIGRALTNSQTVRRWMGTTEQLNRKTAAQVNGEFLAWHEGVGDRPFFAFLNYYDAHQPYLPPADFDDFRDPTVERGQFRYDTNLVEIEDWFGLSPAQVAAERDAYDGAIRYLDHQIGSLLDTLQDRGALDDTLVIVTSDHGEQFGEHRLYDHGNSLYLPLVRVALILRLPGRVPAGRRVAAPVSHRDLPQTVFDLIGAPAPAEFPGESWSRYWRPDAPEPEPAILLSEALVLDGARRKGDMKALLVPPYHYIRNGDGTEELYDIGADLDQRRDLTATARGAADVKAFARALDAVLERLDSVAKPSRK